LAWHPYRWSVRDRTRSLFDASEAPRFCVLALVRGLGDAPQLIWYRFKLAALSEKLQKLCTGMP
jgi:hypothetical protein